VLDHWPLDILILNFARFCRKYSQSAKPHLSSGTATQKPQVVIDRISYFYEHENSNIPRAAHELAARATDAYEKARDTVTHFLNASSSKEIVFVRGTTEGINLVAQSWGAAKSRCG
jgi:selenocysteine lyase/cysteine desulfurase